MEPLGLLLHQAVSAASLRRARAMTCHEVQSNRVFGVLSGSRQWLSRGASSSATCHPLHAFLQSGSGGRDVVVPLQDQHWAPASSRRRCG